MRVGKLLAFVSSAMAFLCAPLVAQTIVTNVTALRMGAFPAANALILTEYANPQDGGGGLFYRSPTSCQVTGTATSVSGDTVTVQTPFDFSAIALNMPFTGLGTTGAIVTAFNASASSPTITLSSAPSCSGSCSFSLNGDNGGTAFVDSSGNCFVRASQTYSQAEWGVGSTSDDTSYLQNWINANQPHIAIPGNSTISGPLYCGYRGLTGQGVIQGSPTVGVAAGNAVQPTFIIQAGSGFSGQAMLVMEPGVNCAIHGVGLIANSPTLGMGNYDTVDAEGNGDTIDGHSYLSGGYYNVDAMNGPGSIVDFELYDSAVNSAVSDNVYIQSANAKVARNSLSGAGMASGGSVTGNNLSFTASDILIANNIIQQARGCGVYASTARLRVWSNVLPIWL